MARTCPCLKASVTHPHSLRYLLRWLRAAAPPIDFIIERERGGRHSIPPTVSFIRTLPQLLISISSRQFRYPPLVLPIDLPGTTTSGVYIYIYNTWTRKRLLLLQFNHFCNCPESSALRRATGTASPASSAAIKQWLVQWCRPEVLDSWCPPNFISFAPIIHYELLPKMTATRLGISMANRSIITQPHKRLVKGGQKRKRKKTRRRKSRCRCGINGPWEALNSAATPARISNEKFRIFLAAVVYVFVKNGSN